MHELGMDTTNNNPNYGTPLNPNNDTYYCGGSSGGSAYAVAAGLVPFAMVGLRTSRVVERANISDRRATMVVGPSVYLPHTVDSSASSPHTAA